MGSSNPDMDQEISACLAWRDEAYEELRAVICYVQDAEVLNALDAALNVVMTANTALTDATLAKVEAIGRQLALSKEAA